MAKTRQRGKSYNDIVRQIERIGRLGGMTDSQIRRWRESGYRDTNDYNPRTYDMERRVRNAGRTANSYLNATRKKSPVTSVREEWNRYERRYDRIPLAYNNDFKVDRTTRTGVSDVDAYARELRRSKRVPESEHTNSDRLRNGGIDALKRYVSSQPDKRTGRIDTKFNWNHRIDSVYQDNKGRYWANVYWQGDSTDGDEAISLDELERGITIPAEHYYDGERTRTRHSDLRIRPSELKDVMSAIADKEREAEDRRYAQKLIDTPREPKTKASSRAEYRARRRAQGLTAG